MMIALLTLLALAPSSAAAQTPPFNVYGQTVEERASTRLGYWRTDRNAGLGEVVISYGRPVWKDQYRQQLDSLTRGKMWRMGDNYWTLLDTQLPIRIGGVDVAAGLYYLAIRRSQDGSLWELVFIDHEKSRGRLLDSYDVGTRPAEIPVLFAAPLEFRETGETVERLTILLTLQGSSRTEGTMSLKWGSLSLSAPVVVRLP